MYFFISESLQCRDYLRWSLGLRIPRQNKHCVFVFINFHFLSNVSICLKSGIASRSLVVRIPRQNRIALKERYIKARGAVPGECDSILIAGDAMFISCIRSITGEIFLLFNKSGIICDRSMEFGRVLTLCVFFISESLQCRNYLRWSLGLRIPSKNYKTLRVLFF
jgi:hypothetical protein